mgnify:CR=1 FL=1
MNIIYNSQKDFSSNISNFLYKCDKNFRKTQINIIPSIILGMILSESSVSSDIAKELKDEFSLIQFDSINKRIKRLFNNKFFDPYAFYDKIIKFVISTYKKKHADKRVHIVFDHMFSHDNFTVFMISMRIGKQGIPLWFRCFSGKNHSDAFKLDTIKDGITYVSNLFDDKFDLIFLADRWFNSTKLMEHIDTLGHTYCLRLKGNLKVTYFDNVKKHNVETYTQNLSGKKYQCKYYKDILYTENEYKTNIVISDSMGSNTPWIIATNGDVRRAVKDYSYRFGAIETMFKNQKSNGFYLESTVNCSLKYFTSLYSLICFATLFLTIFGADYTKNTRCYKKVKLTTHKNFKDGSIKRIMSLFNIGLTLFKRAFNSSRYIRVPYTFTLYDV